MRKYVEGRNPQTVSRGKFTRATALVASAHPNPPKKKGFFVDKLNVGDFFLPTLRVRGGSLISRMNDYNNDDFPSNGSTDCRLSVRVCKCSSFANKSVRVWRYR
jgi:hypothetical protein